MALSKRWIHYFCIAVSLGISMIPLWRLLSFIHQNIQNVVSVDDVMIAPLIGKILEGKYAWQNLFKDTFINGHFQFWPIMTQLGFAKFFGWNQYYILYFGLFLAALKGLLIYLSFTVYVKNALRWLLLPLLSFLIFSPTQLTVYEFGFASMQLGLNHLGMALGVWGLLRFNARGFGLGLMVFGGCLSSWSWANGVLLWPVFLCGLIFLRAPRRSYLVWWAAALLLSYPYLHFLILHPIRDLYPIVEQRPEGFGLPFVSLFNLSFLIRALGWPLTENLSRVMALTRGLMAALLLVSGVWLVDKQWKQAMRASLAAPVMILLFGLLNIWQISLFRWHMAQWYAAPFMMVWVGFVGLAYLFSQDRKEFFRKQGAGADRWVYLRHFWAELVLLFTVFFYASSNLSFANQSYYAQTKSRISESCLRNYQSGPTYCEQTVFLWDPGQLGLMARLGRAVDKNHLSVFAPRRTLTLQGDYILDDVRLRQEDWVLPVFWTKDLQAIPVSFKDTAKLNLFLHTPNAIDWKIKLPPKLKKAELRTAAAISVSAPFDQEADGAFAQVWVIPQGQDPILLSSAFIGPKQRDWVPFDLSLLPYQGQTVTIRLTSQMNTGILHDWMMFRYPEIKLELAEEVAPRAEPAAIVPSNTDLSSDFVKNTARDLSVAGSDKTAWRQPFLDELPDVMRGTWLFKYLRRDLKSPLQLCLADYSHLVLKIGAPEEIFYRAVKVTLWLGAELREIWIPLLKDGNMHSYSYDLKLLELPRGAKVTGLRLDLPEQAHTRLADRIKLEEVRWVRRNQVSLCR